MLAYKTIHLPVAARNNEKFHFCPESLGAAKLSLCWNETNFSIIQLNAFVCKFKLLNIRESTKEPVARSPTSKIKPLCFFREGKRKKKHVA